MKAIPVPLPKSVMRIAAVFAAALANTLVLVPSAAGQPGYHCAYEREGDYGRLYVDFEVPRNNQSLDPPPYLRWEAARARYSDPQVSAAFYRMADGHYRIENGYASISWNVRNSERGPLTLSLQLRSRPEAPRYARTALASDYVQTGGPVSIGVDWSDIAAFARGARELHVVAVDRNLQLVATAPIDRTVFERAEAPISAALIELESIISNPAATCEFLEDLRSNDVVVTSGR